MFQVCGLISMSGVRLRQLIAEFGTEQGTDFVVDELMGSTRGGVCSCMNILVSLPGDALAVVFFEDKDRRELDQPCYRVLHASERDGRFMLDVNTKFRGTGESTALDELFLTRFPTWVLRKLIPLEPTTRA